MWGEKTKALAFILAALLILMAYRGGATGTLTDCAGTTITSSQIKDTTVKCWVFDGQDDSPAFYITAKSALFCLDSNIAAEAIGNARVMLRRCHLGSKPGSNPEYQCISVLDAALDGTAGADGTQNTCERVGPGVYYGEVTVSAGGQTALMSVQGE